MGGRDEQDKLIVRSVDGKGENFEDVLEQHLSRRSFLKAAAVTSGLVVAATAMGVDVATAQTRPAPMLPKFRKVSPTAPEVDEIAVPDGYLHLQETFSDVVKTDKTGLSKTAHTRWMISAFANFLPGSTIFRLA